MRYIKTTVKYSNEQQAFIDNLNNNERKAFELAKKCHEDSVTHMGYVCYGFLQAEIVHVVEIAMQCKTEDERITALLHEVVGQNLMEISDLEKEINNPKVIEALKHLENDPMFKDIKYLDKCKQNEIAKTIKVIDYKCLQKHAGGPFFTGFLQDYAPAVNHAIRYLQDMKSLLDEFDPSK